jgi:phage terminase large subunit
LLALGRKPVLVPDLKVEDGINAAHMMFKRVWFDEARCAPGLEALRQHRVDYDEKTIAFKKTAKEDWTSDAADAFRYVAMAWREIVKVPELPKKRLFIPAEELTMNDWVRFGRERKPERA